MNRKAPGNEPKVGYLVVILPASTLARGGYSQSILRGINNNV